LPKPALLARWSDALDDVVGAKIEDALCAEATRRLDDGRAQGHSTGESE